MASIDLSSMSSALEPGYYTLQASSQLSGRTSGVSLDGNGNGIGGDAYRHSIYVAIPGDANLDGDVDTSQANIFQGTNVGDAAITFSNLGQSSLASWGLGDFNGDGDVDSSQVNIFLGTNQGDAAIVFANLGRNVQPSASLPVMSASVTSAPVVQALAAATPVSESVVLSPSKSQVSDVGEVAQFIEVPQQYDIEASFAKVAAQETVYAVVDLDQEPVASEPLVAQLPVLSADFLSLQSAVNSSDTQDEDQVSENAATLELAGSHDLVDDAFAANSFASADLLNSEIAELVEADSDFDSVI